MLGAAIIVFRETLEAALLIGIVAAATRALPSRNRWLAAGIAAGLLGSLAVAALTDSIGQLADGVGQELFSAGILGVAVLMLGWHNIWMAKHGAEMAAQAKNVASAVNEGRSELSAIAIVIAMAVLREGSETVLFLYGLASGGELTLATALAGGAAGLAAGASVGAVIYLGLLRVPLRRVFAVTGVLILLLAAGMAAQMARILIQADLLPSFASPLWDTADWLPVTSPLGSVLHMLAGYDARPAGMQVLFYAATLAAILFGMHLARPQRSRPGRAVTT